VYVVYVHTNLNNTKRYIGWAAVEEGQSYYDAMMRRWKDHCYDSKIGSKRLFHNAIRKHGDVNWEHEVLDVLRTLDGVKHAEILWITQRHSYAFDEGNLGYNMTRGGDGVHGYEHTLESRQKNSLSHKGLVKTTIHLERLRISNTGKKRSKMTCENIGASKRGVKHPFYGKCLNKEICLAIRAGQPNRRCIMQFTKNSEFIEIHASIADAQRKTGTPATNIVKCCRGHLKTAGKFVWRYVEQEKK